MAASGKKFSILFIRDDSDVRRYRVNPVWFKVGLIIVIILILLAAAGIYASFHLWRINSELSEQNRKLSTDLTENAVRLERLENLGKIDTENIADPRDLLAAAAARQAYADKEAAAKRQETQPEEIISPSNHTIPENASDGAAANRTLADAGEGNASSSDSAGGAQPAWSDPVDLGFVKIENLSITTSSSDIILNFNLVNSGKTRSVAGLVSMELVTKNKQLIPAVLKRDHDTDFQIQRYKRINSTISMPPDIQAGDIYGVKLSVLSSDKKVLFSDVYQMPGQNS